VKCVCSSTTPTQFHFFSPILSPRSPRCSESKNNFVCGVEIGQICFAVLREAQENRENVSVLWNCCGTVKMCRCCGTVVEQFHNTDTFSLLQPYPFSSLSTLFRIPKITLFVVWKLGRSASMSSAKHKKFQIHGGWVQKLRRF